MELVKKRAAQYAMVFEKRIVAEESFDAIVPDIFPDAERVIGGFAEVRIKEKHIVEGKIRVTGEVNCRAFCQAEEGSDIFSVETVQQVTYTWDAEQCRSTDFLMLESNVMYVQPAMLNPRKINGKVQIAFQTRVYQRSESEYAGGLKSDTADRINTLVERASQQVIVSAVEKRIAINEEIRLTGPKISDGHKLYRCDTSWITDDIKVMQGKAMVRGSCRLQVLTISEKAVIATQNVYMLPYSQIIEIDGVDANDMVELTYQTMSANTRLELRQEGAMFLCCEITASAAALVSRAREIELLTDTYSTAYEMSCETVQMMVPQGPKEMIVATQVSEMIEPPCKAIRVCDFRVCGRCESVLPAEGIICGELYCEVMYEAENGCIYTCCRRMNVQAPIETDKIQNACYNMHADGISVIADADGRLLLTGKAVFYIKYIECKMVEVVKNCKLYESCKQKNRKASLILRSYAQGESIWSMAKKYNTTAAEIIAANKITCEADIAPGRLIIIPFGQ